MEKILVSRVFRNAAAFVHTPSPQRFLRRLEMRIPQVHRHLLARHKLWCSSLWNGGKQTRCLGLGFGSGFPLLCHVYFEASQRK